MTELTETALIQAQKNFEIAGGLNPVQIEIDDRILNILKEYKNVRYSVKILQTANCMINYLFRIFNYSKKRFDSLKKECPANCLPVYRDF